MGWETAAGLALAAAGTGVSVYSAKKSRDDMNASLKQSLLQTKEFQKQATPIAEAALQQGGAKTAKKTQAEGAAKAREAYAGARIPGGKAPLPSDGGRAEGYITQQQDASAEGEGYKESRLADAFRNNDASRRLGVISSLAQSVSGTAPVLASLAGSKSASLGAIGSLMSTAGSLAGVYGSIKANSPKVSYKPSEVGLVN